MQLSLFQLLILAVVQGITEFLPISSDGHLVVLSALMLGGDQEALDKFIEVNIVLHIGTLFSILVYYWAHVWRLLREDRRVIGMLVVGTLPAVMLGLPIREFWPEMLSNPLLAGIMLPVTGLLLIIASKFQSGEREYTALKYWQVGLIGCAQALAILPGLSRSGTTITSGLVLGLSPRSAATFSFLLALPAIAGAGLLETIKMSRGTTIETPISHLVLAALVSFGVGLVSITLLMRMLQRGKLYYFAWWCIPLGVAVVVWQLGWARG